jgi:hypothetical protein
MNSGRYALTQVLDLVERKTLTRLAERYNIRTRHFGCRQQLICMGFAQLTWRESLREIEECLNAKGAAALYHLGLREPLADRTVLPLDQTAHAHQKLLRHFAQRGEDPSVDRSHHLRAHCYPAKLTQVARIVAHKSADFERSPF